MDTRPMDRELAVRGSIPSITTPHEANMGRITTKLDSYNTLLFYRNHFLQISRTRLRAPSILPYLEAQYRACAVAASAMGDCICPSW